MLLIFLNIHLISDYLCFSDILFCEKLFIFGSFLKKKTLNLNFHMKKKNIIASQFDSLNLKDSLKIELNFLLHMT